MKSDNIVLVDICGTLYNSNTTFDFLDFYVKNKSYLFFRKCSRLFVWKVLNKFSLVTFKFDLTRAIAIKYLRNKTKEDLSSAADLFYEKVLINLKYTEVTSLLDKLKSDGMRLVLVSATIDFIAKKVSQEMGISEIYSTELVYQNDVCMGKIQCDLLANKLKYLKLENILPPYNLTITDNFSDIDLLKNSSNQIIISKNINIKRWQSLIGINKMLNFIIVTV